MTDIPAQAALENNAELEAVADQLLADMNRIAARSQNHDLDIERLKAETSLLKTETSLLKAEATRLETENRATLARINAVLDAMAEGCGVRQAAVYRDAEAGEARRIYPRNSE